MKFNDAIIDVEKFSDVLNIAFSSKSPLANSPGYLFLSNLYIIGMPTFNKQKFFSVVNAYLSQSVFSITSFN